MGENMLKKLNFLKSAEKRAKTNELKNEYWVHITTIFLNLLTFIGLIVKRLQSLSEALIALNSKLNILVKKNANINIIVNNH